MEDTKNSDQGRSHNFSQSYKIYPLNIKNHISTDGMEKKYQLVFFPKEFYWSWTRKRKSGGPTPENRMEKLVFMEKISSQPKPK